MCQLFYIGGWGREKGALYFPPHRAERPFYRSVGGMIAMPWKFSKFDFVEISSNMYDAFMSLYIWLNMRNIVTNQYMSR